MSTPHNKSRINLTQLAVGIVAVLTPTSYIIGALYYRGLMEGYGIDASNFPIDINNTYVYFYLAALQIFSSFIGVMLNLFKTSTSTPQIYYNFVIATTASIAIYIAIKIGKNSKKYISEKQIEFYSRILSFFHIKNNDYVLSIGVVGFILIIFFMLFYMIAIIYLIWWFIPYASYDAGQKSAQKTIKLYEKNGCYFPEKDNWNSCITVLNENQEIIYEGISLAEGNGKISILNGTGSHVFEFQKNYIITRKLNKK